MLLSDSADGGIGSVSWFMRAWIISVACSSRVSKYGAQSGLDIAFLNLPEMVSTSSLERSASVSKVSSPISETSMVVIASGSEARKSDRDFFVWTFVARALSRWGELDHSQDATWAIAVSTASFQDRSVSVRFFVCCSKSLARMDVSISSCLFESRVMLPDASTITYGSIQSGSI